MCQIVGGHWLGVSRNGVEFQANACPSKRGMGTYEG